MWAILAPILKDLFATVLEMFAFTEKTSVEVKETKYYAKGPDVPVADDPRDHPSGDLFDDRRV